MNQEIQVSPTNMTVANYCGEMKDKKIHVNRDYQRSPGIWPEAAQAYLIETIMLGFPVPKLSLYPKTDLRTRRTTREIIDGQQRSLAIFAFFEGKLRLPKKSELDCAGKTYDELDDHEKQRFLQYQLSIDEYLTVRPEQIWEAFRRMNSYTVALNKEEQRHAKFQGSFKWFMSRQARMYAPELLDLGVLTQRQITRMADAKLLTEVVHAIVHGISTTNSSKLDRLYRENDEKFDSEDDLVARLEAAFDAVGEHSELHGGPLMKGYCFYSLMLAFTHLQSPVAPLSTHFDVPPGRPDDWKGREFESVHRLGALAGALEDKENAPEKFASFLAACDTQTNVEKHRVMRFRWFCWALSWGDANAPA